MHVSSPSIEKILFYRLKNEPCELVFILLKDGQPEEFSGDEFKIVFYNSNRNRLLELDEQLTISGRRFELTQEQQKKLGNEKTDFSLFLNNKTIASGQLIWGTNGRDGIRDAPEIVLEFITADATWLVHLGYRVVDVNNLEQVEQLAEEVRQAKTQVLAAKTAAESANTTAQGHRNAAEAAKTAAETARSGAETAKTGAEAAEVAAAAAKTAAESANTTAQGHRNAAEAAKTAAETARSGAETAKTGAESAQAAAAAAKNESEHYAFYSAQRPLAYYGIEFDTSMAASAMQRIGNMDLHRELPYHRRIRHCLLLDDGTVNYYTHTDNQALRQNGLTADLSGVDGQRMIQFPESYWRFEREGPKRRVMLSEYPLPGFFRVPELFVSPDGACMHRPSGKLSSVVTASPDYRGGNNNAAWDLESRTLLQKEATAMSLAAFRNAARLRGPGWEGYNIQGHELITWLIRIEYANLNCQLAYNPVLDANGFRQGGLGPGVTNLISADWTAFNSQYPFLPTGIGASLGNGTGIVPFDMPVEYKTPTVQVQVPVWRGIANPFGHIWKWLDGVLFNFQAADAGGESRLYTAYDRSKFSSTSFADYDYRGLTPRNDGYVKEILFDDMGGFFPSVTTGGSSATYFSDYWYQSVPASGVSLRGCLVGGSSLTGAHAGLGCATSYNAPSSALAHIGSRLCFFGA